MKVYNVTLEGKTDKEVFEWARGFVFDECETTEQEKPTHSEYIGTVEGIDVYYAYGADYHFFVIDN